MFHCRPLAGHDDFISSNILDPFIIRIIYYRGGGRFPEKQSPRLNERTIILATGRLNGTESLDFEATDLSWMG